MPTRKSKVLPGIIAIHREELSFLFYLRERAVCAPQYFLDDLAELDGRIEAHLEGLRIAGDRLWAEREEAAEWKEAGEAFAAMVLCLESGDEGRLAAALRTGTGSEEGYKGLVAALGWVDPAIAGDAGRRLMGAGDPVSRKVAVATFAAQRLDPGNALTESLWADDPALCVQSIRAAGELGRIDLLPLIADRFESTDGEVRFWAAWSATVLGEPKGIPILVDVALRSGTFGEMASDLAFRRLDPERARHLLNSLAGNPEKIRCAIQGAGASGDPEYLPWLLEQMGSPVVARLAGEAFSTITGIDLRGEGLEGRRPEAMEARPSADPGDEDVTMDPDEDLPWPDVDAVASVWGRRQAEWRPGTRLFLGKPIGKENLRSALRSARQRQRAAAAMELAFLDPGQQLFNVGARGDRQKALLV